eukprot:1731602-Rhodomonas_salina.1
MDRRRTKLWRISFRRSTSFSPGSQSSLPCSTQGYFTPTYSFPLGVRERGRLEERRGDAAPAVTLHGDETLGRKKVVLQEMQEQATGPDISAVPRFLDTAPGQWMCERSQRRSLPSVHVGSVMLFSGNIDINVWQ